MRKSYWMLVAVPLSLAACNHGENDDCINGLIRCDGQCVNPASSHDHCGKCGNSCDEGEFCVSGSCGTVCNAPNTTCGDSCVNLNDSNEHCGKCDNPCNEGEVCSSGHCDATCLAPNTICDGQCVNLDNNDDYCGACDVKCGPGSKCKNRTCHECPDISNENWCNGDALTDEFGCDSGYICANGVNAKDITPCKSKSDCGPGERCDSSNGLCWPLVEVQQCSITITYDNPVARSVKLAGEFTSWGDNAIQMVDRGNGHFEAKLSGESFQPGQLYGYKFIVDGNWLLDNNSSYRKYEGNSVNSAFRFPKCNQPEIAMDTIVTKWTGNGGTFETSVQVKAASDAKSIKTVSFMVDGQEITGSKIGDGKYKLSGTVEAGRHVMAVRVIDEDGREADPVDAVFWMEEEEFNWNDSALYLLFIDRFANGDSSNDQPLKGPVNWAADWHGGDLAGAQKVLESGYFEKLGVKAIWLSPVNAQVEGYFIESGGSHQIAPYHGYWPVKAREVEKRYGGNEALKSFVDAAHKRGIRVLLDLVNNQVHQQHEYVSAHSDWFRTGCVCGTENCGWSEKPLECLFTTYLPDVNWLNEECADQFIDDAANWVAEYGVDGFRVDAVKHVEINSIYNMRAMLHQRFEQGGTRMVMVGETAVGGTDSYHNYGLNFNNGYEWIMGYTGEYGLDGQFDFPTYHWLNNGGLLQANMSFHDVETAISTLETNYSIASKHPLHVSYLGSHDTNRIITRSEGSGNAGCKWNDDSRCQLPTAPDDPYIYKNVKNAWTLLMTGPFMPLIYNGDEIALPGGEDPDNRRDMVWYEDELTSLNNPGIDAAQLKDLQKDVRSWLEDLAKARKENRVLTRGYRKELYLNEKFYVYARYDLNSTAVVVINNGAAINDLKVTVDPMTFKTGTPELVAGSGNATYSNGTMTINVPNNSSAIFIIK